MKQISLLVIFLVLAHVALPQNVGIGEPNPTVKLTVKSEPFMPSLLLKNSDDDSVFYANFRNLHLGGYHLTANGVVNISNKNFLPIDPAQLNLVAAGERSAGFANGSITSMKFSNVNSNKYFELTGYAGGEIENQYFNFMYRDPDEASQFRYLMAMKPTGQVGFGTFSPSGRVQINHRAGTFSPTLNLVDSANSGATIQFGTTSATDYWQIRGNIIQSSPSSSYLEFGTQTAPRMFLRGDGLLGLGVFPTERLDMIGNARINGEVNRPSTGAANLVPVAYGTIGATGIINSGSGNFSVDHLATGLYIITITGETYLFSQYATTATCVGSTTPLVINTGSGAGNLQVRIYNLSGVATDGIFSFVVYKQ